MKPLLLTQWLSALLRAIAAIIGEVYRTYKGNATISLSVVDTLVARLCQNIDMRGNLYYRIHTQPLFRYGQCS